jgi:hypothetical protein
LNAFQHGRIIHFLFGHYFFLLKSFSFPSSDDILAAAVRTCEMMDASLPIEIFCTRPAATAAAMISLLRVKMGTATARIQRKHPGRLEI